MDQPEHMACQELVEVITEYLEGTLPAGDRGRFEAHLALCEPCVVYLDQMRTTIAVAGRIPHDELPAPMRDKLLAAFRGWRAA
jgi:anti-sigma factor RsiW